MRDAAKEFEKIKLVPVVKIDRIEDAVPLAKALTEGGLPVAEVTFRTPYAKEAMRRMKEAFPDMLVGAGTVLRTEQVDAALEAGAEFIVSPGLNPKTVRYCQQKQIPIFPGVATASEIEQAMELGLSVVKFFPAEVNGGIKAIKALSAPYHEMRFMPTGGVNPQNIKDYLAFDEIIACGGTWMVKDSLLAEGKFEEVRELCREAVALIGR